MGKLLRRYNYVLMERPSREPLLILMGKIERRSYTEQAAPEELLQRQRSQQPGAETGAAPQTQLPRTRRRGGDGAAATAQKRRERNSRERRRSHSEGRGGTSGWRCLDSAKSAQAQAQQPETAKQPAEEGQQATAAPKAGRHQRYQGGFASAASRSGSRSPSRPGPPADTTLVWTAEGRF